MKSMGSGLIGLLTKLPLTAIIMALFGIFSSLSHAAPFPIAAGGVSQSFSFDGSNYLVGVENHLTITPNSPSPTIGAQMISADGAKVGELILTGRTGIATNVAFDGTNFLLIWEDDGLNTLNGGSQGFQVYGQFISTAGTAVGSPFDISGLGIWFDGVKTMAFGGGKYLVTYTRLTNPALGSNSSRYIAGRIVDPSGSVGNEIRISTGFGKASDVAFDGNNFFVIWCDDTNDQEIRGRFVSPSGVVGTEISVNASVAPSDNPNSVTFDGTNYLVVWNDEVSGKDTGTWDVFGQLVSPAGALVGGRITVTNELGPQMVTTVAFDGSNYLAVWMDMSNDANGNGVCDAGEGTCWDMYGQYIRKNGALLGSKIIISNDAENQIGGLGFTNGKYLVLINSGVVMDEDGIIQVNSANGLFITPSSNQYTASGTFTYTGGVSGGPLSLTWSNSNFVCNGPELGADSQTVTSLTETTMTWAPNGNDTGMTWTRASGTAGVITGTWSMTDAGSGATYVATFSNGTVSVTGTMGPCMSELSVTISGEGSVNSTTGTPGIHGSTAGTYSSFYPWNSPVTLTAAPSTGWNFSGWTGPCSGNLSTCSFITDSQRKDVNATFTVQQNVKHGSTYYSTLASALQQAALADTDELLLKSLIFPEEPVFNKAGKLISLKGGYIDSLFTDDSGTSVISGSLTIQSGTLSVQKIAIK